MAPAWQAGAEWVHVRPLRPPRAARETSRDPGPRPQPPAPSPASHHRPPPAGVKLVRPRRRPPGAHGCRRSSLTPHCATARTSSDEERAQRSATSSPSAAPDQRARPACALDSKGPHGCAYVPDLQTSPAILRAGVASPKPPEWADASVPVLLRVYARYLTGSEQTAPRRIEEAAAGPDDDPRAE